MDHSLKVWKFDTKEIKLALQASDFYDGNSKKLDFLLFLYCIHILDNFLNEFNLLNCLYKKGS